MSTAADNYFKKIIVSLVPSPLRKPKMRAWLLALVKPVRGLYDELEAYKPLSRKKLNRSGQTLSFESFLNEEFPSSTGIKLITEANETPLLMVGFGAEADQGFFAGFGTDADQGVYLAFPAAYKWDYDFIVQVPASSNFDIPRLTSLVRQFKLAGKRFIIKKGTTVLGSGTTAEAQPNYNDIS